MSVPPYRIGVDVGGTFTDVVLLDEASGAFVIGKVASTPDEPQRGILDGVKAVLAREVVDPSAVSTFVHGTTLGLNTLLQRSGAVTGLLVTSGFRDVLELRRVRLPGAPSFYVERPRALVPRRHVREVDERVLANGRVLRPLDVVAAVAAASHLRAAGVEAIAICFLHAYRNPVHEQEATAAIRAAFPDLYVCASHEVWPQQREYERALITTMNAVIAPRLVKYFEAIEQELGGLGVRGPVLSTKSNGGVMTVGAAARAPVETLLSGPAAGVTAAAQLGRITGRERLIAFDMGGTSADVSVVDGRIGFSSESQIGDFPLILPAVDVTSIGAGGGSIAWADSAGVLKVGPRSAGARPGPACYGLGGTEPTVTDAYVITGLIAPDEFLGGQIRLRPELAERALADLGRRLGLDAEQVATGILRVATATMYAEFLPVMAQRGVDHRVFALLAYGGAGPTHAFLLAREVGIRTVIVPPSPGTLCALGCLLADLRADFVRTVYTAVDDRTFAALASHLEDLEAQAAAWLEHERVPTEARHVVRSADMRYRGQSFEVTVEFPSGGICGVQRLRALFGQRHHAVYGFADESAPVELINLRVQAVGSVRKPAELMPRETPKAGNEVAASRHRSVLLDGVRRETAVYRRDSLAEGSSIHGPAVIVQYDTTVFVPPGFRVSADRWQNLIGEQVSE